MLFDKVCEHLNLLEKDYFGLVFQENPEQKVSEVILSLFILSLKKYCVFLLTGVKLSFQITYFMFLLWQFMFIVVVV